MKLTRAGVGAVIRDAARRDGTACVTLDTLSAVGWWPFGMVNDHVVDCFRHAQIERYKSPTPVLWNQQLPYIQLDQTNLVRQQGCKDVRYLRNVLDGAHESVAPLSVLLKCKRYQFRTATRPEHGTP